MLGTVHPLARAGDRTPLEPVLAAPHGRREPVQTDAYGGQPIGGPHGRVEPLHGGEQSLDAGATPGRDGSE